VNHATPAFRGRRRSFNACFVIHSFIALSIGVNGRRAGADELRDFMGSTLILSDLHLGRRHRGACTAQGLRPLWQGFDQLVLNGDIAEIHHPEHWSAAAREVLSLHDACEQDGVDLVLLSGNHDPFISDRRSLLLADGDVFITHGDVLHPAVAPWSPAAARMRRAHDEALATVPTDDRGSLESRLSVSQHASFAEWREIDALAREAKRSTLLSLLARPWSIGQVLYYWRVFPRLAARFAAEHAPQARYVVVGHTHRAGVRQIGDRWVFNTGSFGLPGRPWAVCLDENLLTYRPITGSAATSRLGAPSLTFPLMSALNPLPVPRDRVIAAPSAPPRALRA